MSFSPEAVSVTRRLYRSGESEYLLNDRICRLRDIQDLFSGTGLSGDHYAIIEQGRIGQILSAKPMDRRTIDEEAAGITKFRVRQRAAEARLENARGNLSRISDIISEIDRVNSLRRQAAKARRYSVCREELRDLLRHVFVAEDRRLTALLDETKRSWRSLACAKPALLRSWRARRRRAHGNPPRAKVGRRSGSGPRCGRSGLAPRPRVARTDLPGRASCFLDKRKVEIEAEIRAFSRLVLVEAECKRLQEQDVTLRSEADATALACELLKKHMRPSSRSPELPRLRSSARAELLQHTAIAERLREIARQLEGTIERLATQAEGLAREGERAAAQHAERVAESERFGAEVAAARTHIAQLNAERETAVHAVVQGHEAVSDTEAELT